jgi:hypothetical protein
MLKKVLNLNGVHLLDKKEQKGILGKGSWPTRCCGTMMKEQFV